jgi:hypothetical protein
MGGSQSTLSQLFKRKHYNDTAYSALSEIPIITIDREETLIPKTPLTYIITFPNNVEGSKAKLESYFQKIIESNPENDTTSQTQRVANAGPKAGEISNFKVILVPIEDFSQLPQNSFNQMKTGLSQVIPQLIADNSVTLMKTNLRDSGCPLVKFIASETDQYFKKSFNLFVAQNLTEVNTRSGKSLYRSHLKQLD